MSAHPSAVEANAGAVNIETDQDLRGTLVAAQHDLDVAMRRQTNQRDRKRRHLTNRERELRTIARWGTDQNVAFAVGHALSEVRKHGLQLAR